MNRPVRHARPLRLAVLGLLALAACPALAGPPEAQLPPPAPGITRLPHDVDARQVAALVASLSDADWNVRYDAQQRLAALGPDALPHLARARRDLDDPHTHATFDLIEQQISEDLAQRGYPVHAEFHEADAVDAIREIARQARLELPQLQVDERRLQGVTINGRIEGRTWWEALSALCAEHDLDARPMETSLRITRATEGAMPTLAGPIATSGPVVILARGARYERRVTIDRAALTGTGSTSGEPGGAIEARFRYELEAMLEPRFVVGSRRFSIVLTGARDDAGNMLLAGGAADGADLRRDLLAPGARLQLDDLMAASVSEATVSGGRLRFEVDLEYPSAAGRRMSLSGRLRGLVGADLYDIDAEEIAMGEAMTWHIAGERVSARLEPSAAAGRWLLYVQSARAVGPEINDLIVTSVGRAELTDAVGDRFRRGAVHNNTGQDGRLTCRVEFIGPADEAMRPHRLRCRLPRRAVDLDLPFQFDNLPMP